MPQQLIYTSAPRLLTAGRSGFGTVARSATMRDALTLRLEQLSYFEHRSLTGGQNRVICACRLLEIRGTRYHVLSRLQDNGLDFTNRTNFLAHHLVFSSDEISKLPFAPEIFRNWNAWKDNWNEEPQLLTNESWGNLFEMKLQPRVPANTWAELTGDAANALSLLEQKAAAPWNADTVDSDTILHLLSESLSLLEVSEAPGDFRDNAWRFTFTTSLQEQDDGADFRWRFVHSDSAVFQRLTVSGQLPLQLSQARSQSTQVEALAFARQGYQAPRITVPAKDLRVQEGQLATLRVEVDGVPLPSRFQWYRCDRSGRPERSIANQFGQELRLENLAQGMHRFCVVATNARGETVTSAVAKVEVEKPSQTSLSPGRTPLRVASTPPVAKTPELSIHGFPKRSPENPDAKREKVVHAQHARAEEERKSRLVVGVTWAALGVFAVCLAAWLFVTHSRAQRAVKDLNTLTEARKVAEAKAFLATENADRKKWLFWNSDVKTALSNASSFVTREEQTLTELDGVLSGAEKWSGAETNNYAAAERAYVRITNLFAHLAPELQSDQHTRAKKEWDRVIDEREAEARKAHQGKSVDERLKNKLSQPPALNESKP